MAATAQWKLRRLAPRVVRIFERRGSATPSLSAFGATLVPVARDFITAYDGVKRFNVKWQKELKEGHGAVADLVSVIRRWLPRLATDLPHFDRSTFADTAVPDDVMEDAERLAETVEEHQSLATVEGSALKPLAYAADLLAELDPFYTAAIKEWREAEAADSDYQHALANTRRLAAQFQQEIVPFRETLASVAGRSDADYQKLRTSRAGVSDPEDDPTAPKAAESQASATTG